MKHFKYFHKERVLRQTCDLSRSGLHVGIAYLNFEIIFFFFSEWMCPVWLLVNVLLLFRPSSGIRSFKLCAHLHLPIRLLLSVYFALVQLLFQDGFSLPVCLISIWRSPLYFSASFNRWVQLQLFLGVSAHTGALCTNVTPNVVFTDGGNLSVMGIIWCVKSWVCRGSSVVLWAVLLSSFLWIFITIS